MQGKPFIWGLIALVIGLVALYVYFQYRVPAGIEPMGGRGDTIAWVSLATAVAGLLTAIVGLVKAVIELRAKQL